MRLVYSDLDEAVALIRQACGTTAPLAADIDLGLVLADRRARDISAAAAHWDLPPDITWTRNPDVVIQNKAGGAFLTQAGRQMIWHLNVLGRIRQHGPARGRAALR